MTRTILVVVGMKDNACRELIMSALEAVPGVREVQVNLLRARATVWHENGRPVEDLIRAIETTGYSAASAWPSADGDSRDRMTSEGNP